MKRFAIISSILAAIVGIVLKGSMLHQVIVIILTRFIGVPLVLFMLGWWGLAWRRTGEPPPKLNTLFRHSLVIVASMYLSLGIGKVVHAREISLVRAYVENIVPKLDEYKQQHGHYPKTLASLNQEFPPTLLAGPHSYVADSSSYRFYYRDSATLMGGYRYESTDRQWEEFH